MTETPLVRDEHGAILGVDWRRVPGASDIQAPGIIEAQYVHPGDRIMILGHLVTVLQNTTTPTTSVYIVTRTDAGAEVVVERSPSELIRVVEVGAFDKVTQP